MKAFITILGTILAIPACSDSSSGPAGPEPIDSPYDLSPIVEFVQTAIDTMPAVEGVAVYLEQGGRPIFARGFGNMTVDDVWLMASVSKTLTAVTVLTLVDDGVLDLDARIHTILPEFNDVEMVDITLRHLLSHTSGLTIGHPCASDIGGGGPFSDIPLRQCARLIAGRGPFAIPGTKFRYSSPAFSVAGALAEAAAGRSWESLYRDRIGDPLGLQRTLFRVPALGDGGVSTAREFARIMRMLADGGVYEGQRVLSSEIVAEMMRDQNATVEINITPRAPELHYGLGVWRERVGPSGEPLMVTGLGSSGFAAWVDLERDLVGAIVAPPTLDHTGRIVGGVWSRLREIVPAGSGSGP